MKDKDPYTAILIDNLLQEITHEYDITTVINTHDMNSVIENTFIDNIIAQKLSYVEFININNVEYVLNISIFFNHF